MADAVQVIHTNAGVYGESGKLGKVDFCLNGGKTQPFCENTTSKYYNNFFKLVSNKNNFALIFFFITEADLCSHVLSLCYMAESIDGSQAYRANPCSRRCPNGPRPTHRLGVPVLFGEHTPEG